jgi:hypothetical protein
VRAAVNWSWRNHQKVLESGEPEPEIHPLEAQAMEEYLAWRDELRTLQDVANGLHQPDGYRQGDGGDDNDNEDVGDVQDDDDEDDAVEDCYDAVP